MAWRSRPALSPISGVTLTLGGNVYFAPDYSQGDDTATYVEGTIDYALPGNFGISGGVGYQAFGSKLDLPDYRIVDVPPTLRHISSRFDAV